MPGMNRAECGCLQLSGFKKRGCVNVYYLVQQLVTIEGRSWAPWKHAWLLLQILSSCITETQTVLVNVGTRVSSTADFLLRNSESMCFLLKIYEQKIEFRGTSLRGFPSNTVFTFEACMHSNLPQVTGNKNNLSFPSPLDFHLLEHLNLLWQRQGNKEPSQLYPSRPKAPDWLNIVTSSQAPSLWERNCKKTSSRTGKWRRCTGSSPVKHLY